MQLSLCNRRCLFGCCVNFNLSVCATNNFFPIVSSGVWNEDAAIRTTGVSSLKGVNADAVAVTDLLSLTWGLIPTIASPPKSDDRNKMSSESEPLSLLLSLNSVPDITETLQVT